MKKCIVIFALLAFVVSAAAAEKKGPKSFADLDADKDGKLSKEEFTGGNEKKGKLFDKLDKDKDGSLSEEEYKAIMKKKKKDDK